MMTAVDLALAEPFRWTFWKWYPSALAGIAAIAGCYALLIGALGRRLKRRASWRQVAFLGGAFAILVVALNGPLHDLSDRYLFSAHMVQHPLLFTYAVPVCLLLGTPGWVVEWLTRSRVIDTVARFLTKPVVTFGVASGVLALWHFPFAYDAAMVDHDVHIGMHISLTAAATLGWWPILSPTGKYPRLPFAGQLIYLFALGLPMALVGALITLAERPLYLWYVQAPRVLPLTPLEDQRIGGLIMWVPGMLVVWAAMTIVWFRWAAQEGQRPADDGPLPIERRSDPAAGSDEPRSA